MDISDLKLIHAIADTGSLNAAAKTLYKSQSSVSKALKRIEDKYNVRLFHRTPTGTEVTKTGRKVLDISEGILKEVDRLNQILYNRERLDEIRIGTIRESFCTHCILESNLGDGVNIFEDSCKGVVEKVALGEYDLGLVNFKNGPTRECLEEFSKANISIEKLGRYKRVLIVSKSGNLSLKDKISESDLEKSIEILRNEEELSDESNRIIVQDEITYFDILNQIKNSYTWALPIPKEILKEFNLAVKENCPVEKYEEIFIITGKHNEHKDLLIDLFKN